MKLVVKNNNGEKFTLQIRPNETFLDLKRRVELESGISLDLRDITTKKRNINEQQKVIDYFMNEQNQAQQPSPAPAPEVVCTVPTCDNKKSIHSDKTYFDFPEEEVRCHQWVLYCRRIASFLSTDNPRSSLPVNVGSTGTAVCSDHFRPDQFVKNTTTLLKRTAVPCINPELPSAPLSETKFNGSRLRPLATTPQRKLTGVLQESLSSVVPPPFGSSSTKLTCRLCAQPSRDTVQIYSKEGKSLMLAEKICASLPIKVKMTDHMPKQICRSCIFKLNEHYHLVVLCTTADDNFRAADEIRRDQEMKEKTQRGECPCCVEGRLSLVAKCPEEPELSDSLTMIGVQPNDVIGDTPLDSIESDGDLILSDMLDFDGSLGGEETFDCRICGAEMNTFQSATDHALSHGVEAFFQCILCENYYTTPQELVDHFHDHQPLSLRDDPLQDDNENPQTFCEKCGLHFTTVLEISEHQCEEEGSHVHKCALCPRSFSSMSRLQFHTMYHTGAIKGECTVCGASYPTEVKLYRHMVEEHEVFGEAEEELEEQEKQCDECGKSFPSSAGLRAHLRTHIRMETGKPFSCEWCGKSFVRRSMLRNHVGSAHKQSQESSCFTCKICKEAFPSTSQGVSHMDSAHNQYVESEPAYSFEMITVSKLFQCEFCEKVFAEGSVLNKHREQVHASTAMGGPAFVCKFCGANFGLYSEVQEHKTLEHNAHNIPDEYKGEKLTVPTAFLCEFCDRVFLNYLKYTEHLTIHFGTEPYICRICGVRFTSLDEVTEHRTIHGDVEPLDDVDFNRPYECHYCNKSFSIEDALVKHIRMHTGEKPFTCDVCGKGFSQSSGLNTHKKVHSDVRPFSCHLCTRTFKIKGDRDVHIRKHSGQRPFKCDFCFKAFMTQHVYSQHRKIHTGERPYRCDICHLAFRRSHVLTVHKRIHTGEKPNVCDVCGKKYRQKGDMLKHKRTQHGHQSSDKVLVHATTYLAVKESSIDQLM